MKKVITLLFLALVVVTCVSAQSEVDFENRCAPKSDQSNVAVYVEVPEFIEAGLTDGSMERIGGVIRYSENQQTIAWLRQGGQMGRVAESTAGILKHIFRLSGTDYLALGKLVASATPLLNMSMAGFSLIEHIAGIRAHEAELERIYDRVSEEFQRDREVKLAAALEFAENTLLVTDDEYSRAATVKVNSDLIEARRQLVEDLYNFFGTETTKTNIELALSTQILAMRVCVMGTRLQLNIGHEDAAIDLLSKCVSEQEEQTQRFVDKWLGGESSRAFYFHESVDDEHFELYLRLEGWLRGRSDVLSEIVHENRQDFWVHEALNPLDSPALFFQIDELPLYKTALPSARLLIENFQRLQGLELELESMCLPTFAEWEAFDGGDGISISEQAGFVLLVNQALMDGNDHASP